MDKILESIIDIVIAFLIMFAAVTIYFGLRTETAIKSIVVKIADDYVTDIKKKGYFTLEDYETLYDKLALTDEIYDVTFEHTYTIWEPEYRMKTLQEILDAQNAAYTGKNVYTYREVSTAVPTVTDPVNTGSLNTETNESILAKEVNTPADANHVHTDECYAGNNGSKFYALWVSVGSDTAPTTSTLYLYCANCNKLIASYSVQAGVGSGQYCINEGVTTNFYNAHGDIDKIYGVGASGWLTPYYASDDAFNNDVNNSLSNLYNNTINKFGIKEDRSSDIYHGHATVYLSNTMSNITLKFPCFSSLISSNDTYTKTYKNICTCPFCNSATPNCDKMITSITPTNPEQTIATGDKLITTVKATYLNGATKTVVVTTDFSTANIAKDQTVTLTYNYTVSDVSYSKTCTIKVNVVPRTKTCKNGHTYNLDADGTDPGCPYCKAWVKSLQFIFPADPDMTITIGTTLQDNGVKLQATYMDGHTETLTHEYADNLDTKYLGTMTVTVGCKGVTAQLRVSTVCAKMICPICGNTYNLYPDQTDPGCPYCIAKIPVFTGKVLDYDETLYTEDILESLYKNGIYEFNQNDMFTVSIKNKSSNIARKILRKIFPSISNEWINIKKSTKICSN